MGENKKHHPGTVSQILWHFTGGPKWNSKMDEQHRKPKPAIEAFQNLIDILDEKKINLGKYSEVLNVRLPGVFSTTMENNSNSNDPTYSNQIKSLRVCCLADIPIMHLEYVAERYGKFAIGFRRKSVINNGFNPVLYTLNDKHIMRNIFESLHVLTKLDEHITVDKDITKQMLDKNPKLINIVKNGYRHLLAFVKTFKEDEFHTIYCEREWRSIEEYNFEYKDLALIIIPKKVGKNYYYKKFCDKYIDKLSIPTSIPVLPWEDIIEY